MIYLKRRLINMGIRYCSRAFIINKENKILLQRFEFPQINGNKTLWVTPGGGIEENETYEEALERELYEELNIKIQINEAPVLTLDVLIDGKKEIFTSHEVYYLICIEGKIEVSFDSMTDNEKDTFKGLKWWDREELLSLNSDEYAPIEILNYI